jgi:uncharacterized protein (DUF2062 family)
MSEKINGFFNRVLIRPLVEQIKQGADANGLAKTVAAGFIISIIPVLGVTTAICVVVGLKLRLNQPVIQAVNYLFYPLQIILLPVFILLGAKIFGVEPVSFDPKTVFSEFTTDPGLFMSNYGMAGLRACLVWVLISPILFFSLKSISYFFFKKLKIKQETKAQ